MSASIAFAEMLRAVGISPAEADAYALKWKDEAHTTYGISVACQILTPWVAPESGVLMHQAYVRGKHVVNDEYRSRVRLFMEFWSSVSFTVGPGLTPDWQSFTIGDAQRALVDSYDLRRAGYSEAAIISAARAGKFAQMVELVHDGVPRDYIETILV